MNLQKAIRVVFLVLIINTQLSYFCYSQAAGMQVFDDVARTAQLYGKVDSLLSFCVRPNYALTNLDSFLNNSGSKKATTSRFLGGLKGIALLPVTFQQQYNTHHPYGWNDGSMIPAKGYENQLAFGLLLNKGIVSLQLRPEVVYTYNSYFSTFPEKHIEDVWKSYYYYTVNRIDAPERFGYGRYFKMFLGQSSFRVNYHKLSFGLSTENLWWGPGVRNSLLMSNNAPGFPHISFNSSQPVTSPIGSFEWQLISGKLKGSGVIPDDTTRRDNGKPLYEPKGDGDRYLNGVVITWQPKWTKGLFIGFSRVFYEYLSDVQGSFDGYLPVMSKFLKKNIPSEDSKKRDQLLSLFFRLIMPREKAELYGEFGRNDHSFNSTDLFLEPEHSRAYIFGFSKTFDGRKRDMQLYTEITNLQMSSTMLLRAQESWYVHYQVRHGYTNLGQVIGAGIGPGSSSQTIGLKWISGIDRIGASIERVVRNNDFYYYALSFAGWQRHWVDLSLNLDRSWQSKTNKMVYNAQASWIHSLNYQWYYSSVFHFSFRFGVAYLFG